MNSNSNSRRNANVRNTSANRNNANTRSKTTTSGKGVFKNVLWFVFFLILIFSILLAIFLIRYILTSCPTETGKKDIWDYASGLDILSSPCAEPQPEKVFEERKEKDENEVWHISDQIYTYPEAVQKCKAYGARLANKNEIIKAYNEGAQWSTYGWSQGREAYYPIQPCEFVKLRRQGLNVGPPGVNGGKFEPHIRFGVNCYGVKPAGEVINPKSSQCPYPEVCQRNPLACKKSKSDHIAPFFPGRAWSIWTGTD
jgi:hypothetical protein